MKHIFTLALSACLVPASFAQLSLNSNEMLSFNSSFTLINVNDPSAVDTTITGANVTWNFAGLQSVAGTEFTTNIVNPANTPYAATFPTANYAYQEQPSGAYRYFTLSSSKMERVGSYSGGTLKTYSNPQTEYIFPLNLGAVNADTWANSGSTFGGTYDMKCVGTGTLILPSGSYQALYVRVLNEEGPILLDVHFWYDANNGSILLQYIQGDGLFVGTSARYIKQITLDMDEAAGVKGLTYNNPVEATLNLGFENPSNNSFTYRIYDINGRILSNGQLQNPGEQVYFSKDISELSAGLYYFTLTNTANLQSKTIKLIKQ